MRLKTNPLYPPWSKDGVPKPGCFDNLSRGLQQGGAQADRFGPQGLRSTTPSVKAFEGPKPLKSDGGACPLPRV